MTQDTTTTSGAADLRTAAPAQPAPSGATEEVENLRKALVYAAFALHGTHQYMLAQGITLIDGDTVRVSRDGWTVEASGNPYRQPAPAAQQAGESVYAFRRKGLEDFCTCDEARYEELSNKPHLFETRVFYTAPQTSPTAQAADSVLEDAARSERERICAAIKVEDDYCVEQGDYMLDSDDCIKIARGDWVRPDFSVDAARRAIVRAASSIGGKL